MAEGDAPDTAQPVDNRHQALIRGMAAAPEKIRSIPLTGAVNAANILLGAMTGILVARVLGPDGRGQLVIGSVGPLVIGSFATLGLEESTVYSLANSTTDAERRTTLWSSMTIGAAFGVLGSLVALAMQLWYFAPKLPETGHAVAYAYASLPLFFILTQIPLAAMRAIGDYVKWNICRLYVSLVYAIVLVALSVTESMSLSSVLLSHLAINAGLGIALVVAAQLKWNYAFDGGLACSLVRLGLGNHLVTIQQLSNQRLDQFVLTRFVGSAALGQYAVAVTYATAALSLALAPAWQLYSHLSRTTQLSRRSFRRVMQRSVVGVSLMAAIGAVAAPFLLPALFGPEFRGATMPTIVLLCASPALAASALYASTWKACGQPMRVARAEGLGLATTVVLLAILLPAYGVTGAAVASFFAYGVVGVALMRGSQAPSIVDD